MFKPEMPYIGDSDLDNLLSGGDVPVLSQVGNVIVYSTTSRKLRLPKGFDEYTVPLQGLNSAWMAKDGRLFLVVQVMEEKPTFRYHIAVSHPIPKNRRCFSINNCADVIDKVMK